MCEDELEEATGCGEKRQHKQKTAAAGSRQERKHEKVLEEVKVKLEKMSAEEADELMQ